MVEIENITPKTVVIIAGPTASGKSALAIEMAERYNGVVINADASQIYKEITVISAAPTAEDKQKVPHRLYEIFEPGKRGSVADWLPLVVQEIKQCWRDKKLPIVVGGTGFYIEALVKGASPIPETEPEIKQKVAQIIEKEGAQGLYQQLQKIDARGAAMVHANDMTRIRRALEIFLSTGRSIADWFEMPYVSSLPEAQFVIVAKLPALNILDEKCRLRVDAMIKNGALEEVKNLMNKKIPFDFPVMRAIGVPEFCAYLKGDVSLSEAAELVKLHTRQYAKRQLTWFRNRLKQLSAKIIEA